MQNAKELAQKRQDKNYIIKELVYKRILGETDVLPVFAKENISTIQKNNTAYTNVDFTV